MKKAARCDDCGKLTYHSRLQAIKTALVSSSERGVSLRVYRCPKNHGFHLTRWASSKGAA